MSFQRIIQNEARRQALSGYRLAKLADVPMRTVQKYLAGDCDLRGERIAKIAAALGLELVPMKRRRTKGKAT